MFDDSTAANYPIFVQNECPQSVSVMLDQTTQFNKPSKIGPINNRLISGKTILTLEELAKHLVENKFSFCPSVFEGDRKNSNWVSQQIFGVDMDSGMTPEAFEDRCTLFSLSPTIMYSTFSDSSSQRKFRALFVMDGLVTEEFYRRLTIGMLQGIFPECDKMCKDANRIFFGGKELLHADYAARIHPMSLSNAFHAHLHSGDKHDHYLRSLVNFARVLNVQIQHDHLAVCELGEIGVNAASPSIYKDMPQKRHFWTSASQVYVDEAVTFSKKVLTAKQHDSTTTKGVQKSSPIITASTSDRLTDKVKQTLLERCELLKNFDDAANPIKHELLFTIANNLFNFRGGQAWFFSMLDKLIENGHEHPDKHFNFKTSIPSLANYQFVKSCEASNCLYFDSCTRSGKTIKDQLEVRKGEIRRVETFKIQKTLDETRQALRSALLQACNTEGNEIWVIKVDTGVGKTEELLKLNHQNTYIGFPTHQLCQEAHERYQKMNRPHHPFLWQKRPALPDAYETEAKWMEMLQLGNCSTLIKKSRDESDDPQYIASCNAYLQSLNEINQSSFIFGTHDKAFVLRNPNIKTYILDEDISQRMCQYFSIATKDVSGLLKIIANDSEPDMTPICDFLRQVDQCGSEKPGINPKNISEDAWKKFIHVHQRTLSSPVIRLFDCDAFMRDGRSGEIWAVKKMPLLEDRKYIILSATADEEIYRHLFGERLRFVDLSGTELRGHLVQHVGRSFSRHSIDADLNGFITRVKDEVGKNNLNGVITFKKYVRELEGKQVPVLAWFHASEGLDAYRGLNIGVFGTPYPPEAVYLLMGFILTGDAGLAGKLNFAVREVEWGGWRFRLRTCSDDPVLVRLQLWLIEAELVQAVGRARLVSQDAVVRVYSSLPLAGAKIVEDR